MSDPLGKPEPVAVRNLATEPKRLPIYKRFAPLPGAPPTTKKFLLLFSKRSAFFCSFLKKRTKKLLFILVRMQPGDSVVLERVLSAAGRRGDRHER
jgi:hypothetical protein